MDWTLKISDLAIVAAALIGPVLAVQAQKWVERSREQRERQVSIFRTLMATRAAWLSQTHVDALNAVPIEFYGSNGSLKTIVTLWKIYIDHFSQGSMSQDVWSQKRVDLLVNLLKGMAKHLGYNFNSVEVSREFYAPRAHSEIQTEQDITRKGLAKLFSGEIALPMEVKTFPVDPDFAHNQIELQRKLLAWLAGEHTVKVTVEAKGDQPGETGPKP